jgi:RND family efflux transporter MFP subunit
MHQRLLLLALLATVLVLALPALAAAQPSRGAAPVSVAVPRTASIGQELRLTGTLTAEHSASVSPRVDGLVARLQVDAGDRVEAGATLLELDATVATLALRRAEANVAEARVRLAEARRLLDEGRRLVAERHLPKTELGRRESEAALAAAALASSEAVRREQAELVRRHVLPAPFAGVVAQRLTDVGEWVSRGDPVFELVATDRVRLHVRAPQERYASLTPDAPVTVLPDAFPGTNLKGRITARVPVTDPTLRTFLVRILIEDADARLLPGTSATAVIGLAAQGEALIVKRDALNRYPDGSYSVFVVVEEGGVPVARERRVRIGRSASDVEVLEGLAPGERVVVRGNEALRSGQPVRIVDADGQ